MSDRIAPFLMVLGIAQDAGYPQAGCHKACCAPAWQDQRRRRHPACLGIVDPESQERWLIDCTPHFPEQLRLLDQASPVAESPGIDGILLTHAHMGHYAGLVHLGREALAADRVPVYAMPRMKQFLSENLPWRLLVEDENIVLRELKAGATVPLNSRIRVTSFVVPHRGEISETVGFRIDGPNRSALYVPDTDSWDDWPQPVEKLIEEVDIAFLDGTFYDGNELSGRDLTAVPHPLIVESMQRFSSLLAAERQKIHFVHLNHTNPVLDVHSEAAQSILAAEYCIAREGQVEGL
jgi:pyrroloquinoline quinone biosynthesis protein B